MDATAPSSPPQRLVCASYNIHRCFGTDRKYLPERVARVISSLNADIVALQEVDMALLVDGQPQLDFLASFLGMEAVPGAMVDDHRGVFGNALLSRFPVRAVRRIDLTVRRYEPRGALDVDIDHPGHPLRAVATHLGLTMVERRTQVRALLKALASHPSQTPFVLMGDFNEWRPRQGALRVLDRRFGASLPLRTFPSRLPVLPLDRIWIWPAPELCRVERRLDSLTRLASDHLPIRAEILWPRGVQDGTIAGKTEMASEGINYKE